MWNEGIQDTMVFYNHTLAGWLALAHVLFMVVPGMMVLSYGWMHNVSLTQIMKKIVHAIGHPIETYRHSHRHA